MALPLLPYHFRDGCVPACQICLAFHVLICHVVPALVGQTSDYVAWVSHVHSKSDGCLLGKKDIFMRLRKDSW